MVSSDNEWNIWLTANTDLFVVPLKSLNFTSNGLDIALDEASVMPDDKSFSVSWHVFLLELHFQFQKT